MSTFTVAAFGLVLVCMAVSTQSFNPKRRSNTTPCPELAGTMLTDCINTLVQFKESGNVPCSDVRAAMKCAQQVARQCLDNDDIVDVLGDSPSLPLLYAHVSERCPASSE